MSVATSAVGPFLPISLLVNMSALRGRADLCRVGLNRRE
jgi:hypothetical protein